jgi:hypothetical protein
MTDHVGGDAVDDDYNHPNHHIIRQIINNFVRAASGNHAGGNTDGKGRRGTECRRRGGWQGHDYWYSTVGKYLLTVRSNYSNYRRGLDDVVREP